MDSRRRRYTRMVGQMDIFGIPGRLRMWNVLVIRHVMGTLGMDFVFGFEASLVSRLREAPEYLRIRCFFPQVLIAKGLARARHLAWSWRGMGWQYVPPYMGGHISCLSQKMETYLTSLLWGMYCQLCSESRGGLLVLELGISTTCVKEKKVNKICPWSFMWDINCERYCNRYFLVTPDCVHCTLHVHQTWGTDAAEGYCYWLMLEAMWLDHVLMHFTWDIRPSRTCVLLNGYIWYRSSCIAFLQQNSNMRWQKDWPTFRRHRKNNHYELCESSWFVTHAQPFPPYLEMLNGARRSVGYDDQAIQASMQSCREGLRRHGYAGCGVPVE